MCIRDSLLEDGLDFPGGILEQRQVGPGGAAQPQQAGAAMVFPQPGRVELVVPRRAAEVPDVGLAGAGEERVARQLVARPLADHRAGGVADVVPVSYTHLRAHETPEHLVCRLLLEKKKKKVNDIRCIYLS